MIERDTLQFRKDINGIRALAVVAVVLFHFSPSLVPGGFAGVDVFFVISGFLMTGIIFRGLEQKNFSIIEFYFARANRIIPALAALCLVLLVFGWFYLPPIDYKSLGKDAAGSILFLSNIFYLKESGYFDATSLEKWLLHTWSLSAEWQFYIIYPVVLVIMRKLVSLKIIKSVIVLGTLVGFIFCIFATYKWPNASYYLLPTRTWEMMFGGVAYLFPFTLSDKRKRLLEWMGLALIFCSYFLITKNDPWPGYLAIFPVLGSFLVIQAHRNNSFITSNVLFQRLGSWSYSIYLWHWPLVVSIYYFSLGSIYTFIGMALSVLLGWLSYKYIERIKFQTKFDSAKDYLKCKPLYLVVIVCILGITIVKENGFIKLAPAEYQTTIEKATISPYRHKCHIGEYQPPEDSCEYFGENISWAILGDSHSVEIAYALAERLKTDNVGLKHFTFSDCNSSYGQIENFSKCTKWYNESVNYILENKKIRNVVLNHRFTEQFFGGDATKYPTPSVSELTEDIRSATKQLDKLIHKLASTKDNVYIFHPIPELPRNIHQLIALTFRNENSLRNVFGTDLNWYEERNIYVIDHFDTFDYPENVYFLKPKEIFCDETICYAVKNGIPLYFDADHPSMLGATKLVELMKIEE